MSGDFSVCVTLCEGVALSSTIHSEIDVCRVSFRLRVAVDVLFLGGDIPLPPFGCLFSLTFSPCRHNEYSVYRYVCVAFTMCGVCGISGMSVIHT